MIVPMIDQSLAKARALIGAPAPLGVAPPAREKFKAANGRAFTKVPASEWRRLLNEALPRVDLVLLTESEVMSGDVLTVTFTLTHYGCGDTRTLTRAEPLPQPAPSKSLAKQWAHTRAVNAMARTLLWQWDDEDEDETEGQAPAPADSRTHAQRQEDERRQAKGLEPYHSNGHSSGQWHGVKQSKPNTYAERKAKEEWAKNAAQLADNGTVAPSAEDLLSHHYTAPSPSVPRAETSGATPTSGTSPEAATPSTDDAASPSAPSTGPSGSTAGPDLSPSEPADRLSGGDGSQPNAPDGGDTGAGSEPPADRTAPAAGVPLARTCTCVGACRGAKGPGWRCALTGAEAPSAAECDPSAPHDCDPCGPACKLVKCAGCDVMVYPPDGKLCASCESEAVPSRCAECDGPLATDSFECPDPECPTNAGPQEGPTLPVPDWMRERDESAYGEQGRALFRRHDVPEPDDLPEDESPLTSPTPEQVSVVGAVASGVEQGRKDRAERWGLCKLTKARSNKGTCVACGNDVGPGDRFREGVSADPTKGPRRSKKPEGVIHEDCRCEWAEGRDPREQDTDEGEERA